MAEQKGKHWNFTRLLTMGKENKHLDKKANQTEIKGEKNGTVSRCQKSIAGFCSQFV